MRRQHRQRIYTISTILSLNTYTSFFGYYSRFNGGLLSLIAYLVIFFSFLSQRQSAQSNFFRQALTAILLSASVVAIYGVAQRFGIDASYWVPNVRARVFSTLGQPNWLAAFLAVTYPIGLAKLLGSQRRKNKIVWLATSLMIFTALWLTYSLSGLLGFVVTVIIFVNQTLKSGRSGEKGAGVFFGKENRQFTIVLISLSLLVMAIFPGLFVTRLRHTYDGLTNRLSSLAHAQEQDLEAGQGNTANIRLLVWQASLEIVKRNPFFGTGPETFAYSFLPVRPQKLNTTTEWAFLYNKAHNEYLHLAACTGIIGLAGYLAVVYSLFRQLKKSWVEEKNPQDKLLLSAIFSGWAGNLVAIFFGFSVVPTALLFWVFPALSLGKQNRPTKGWQINLKEAALALIGGVGGAAILAIAITQARADMSFSKGLNLQNKGRHSEAVWHLEKSFALNPREPAYGRELALAYARGKNETVAIAIAKETFKLNPNNMLSLKSLTRTYFVLARENPALWTDAVKIAIHATKLSPTDPQAGYNLAVVYYYKGNKEAAKQELERTLSLKPDYLEAAALLSELSTN